MKSVIFFRHGKSNWSADFETDFDRPLAGRGSKASKRMGIFLAKSGYLPDLILTSPAVRAKRTIEIAKQEGGWPAPVETEDQLYGADPDTVLSVIRHATEDSSITMIVGHEPTMSDCVRKLSGATVRFPTAAMCRIDFEIENWKDAAYGQGELIWHVPPKLLS